jgi:two-component system sensor histidine kinase NblS
MSSDAPLPPSIKPSQPSLSFFSGENRVLLGVISLLSVAFLLGGLLLFNRYQQELSDHYDAFGQLLVSIVAVEAQDRLASPSPRAPGLDRLSSSLLAVSRDVAAIEFYDQNGKALYADQQTGLDDSPLTDYSAPVRLPNGQHVGEVHVKLTGRTMERVATATKQIVIVVFLSAWLLSVLAVLLNTYVWSKHLRMLLRGVQRLSSGDFGYRIPDKNLWGELRELARAFNDMSLRLKAYEDQNIDDLTFERNKLEAVLLSISDGVIVCDEGGRAIIVNEAAAQMLGLDSSQVLVGEAIQTFSGLEGQPYFEPMLKDFALHQKKPLAEREAAPFAQLVKVGKKQLKIFVSPIQNAAYNRLGFVMIMHDVTRETEVDKLKTNFISNVSHELRTPVTTIQSYVDTIFNHSDELDPDTYKEFIATIHLETERLKKLVNDILDFSKLEEGAYELDRQWEELAPIINLTVQSVRVLAAQKELTITTSIESNLPLVLINSESIERVLRNLLSNAIKYTAEGGRIKVKAEVSGDGQWVEVLVQDNGVGVPAENLKQIFDRFYRVENKVHTVKGTGLGLHLVKVAIENHHDGQVFVSSEEGVGSTFGFRLPVQNTADTV